MFHRDNRFFHFSVWIHSLCLSDRWIRFSYFSLDNQDKSKDDDKSALHVVKIQKKHCIKRCVQNLWLAVLVGSNCVMVRADFSNTEKEKNSSSQEKVIITHMLIREQTLVQGLSDGAQAERSVRQHHFLDKPAEAPGEDGETNTQLSSSHKQICYPRCHLAVLLRKTLDLHPRLHRLGDPPSVLHAVRHWHRVQLVWGWAGSGRKALTLRAD